MHKEENIGFIIVLDNFYLLRKPRIIHRGRKVILNALPEHVFLNSKLDHSLESSKKIKPNLSSVGSE